MIEKEFEHVSNHINKLTAKNLDLNDKESFINELQSALSIGEICPVCGNEIQSLENILTLKILNYKTSIRYT